MALILLTRPVFDFVCRPMRILVSYSTSDKRALTLPDEKEFKTTPALPPLHMDTHKLVTDLTSAGYNQSQAEAAVTLFRTSIQSTVSTIIAEHVKRHELDILSLRLKGDVESIRSNMVLIERSVVGSLRKDNEALKGQIEKLMAGFKEEVVKVQSGLSLDLNLEKSRIKEESTGLKQLIKDTNNTIEKEPFHRLHNSRHKLSRKNWNLSSTWLVGYFLW
ncbi:uncharacterized protein LOC135344953 isoform X2 [Halichondria panicea]|uniref:uncharacterized protein LOC135344953 isoform X2 n=1 Tax=Halichondria panicea TaxID=6063 RepID=UPI00312B9F8C